MSTIHTIRGPIDSANLGRTLSHEHLCTGAAGMERIPSLLNRPEMIARCVEALERVRRSGIDAVIDLTPFDLGRQMWLFEAVAERTDMHVVCATGVYRWVPPIYFGWSEDEVAEHFVREITDGIEGTGIKAGIIKLAWDLEARLTDGRNPPRAMLEKMARGAARAAKATGVPISCHTLATDRLGIPLLDLFADEGMDLRAVTIGHSNDTADMEYLTGLARRGATVGLDRFQFALATDEYVAQRGSIALALVQAGYAEQVCLGHDASPAGLWGRWNPERHPECWTLVPEREVPWLRAHGATDDHIDALLHRSVRATFEAAAKMRK